MADELGMTLPRGMEMIQGGQLSASDCRNKALEVLWRHLKAAYIFRISRLNVLDE